jgi:hypothetical protein
MQQYPGPVGESDVRLVACLHYFSTRRRARLRRYARLRWSNTLRVAIRPRRHHDSFNEDPPLAHHERYVTRSLTHHSSVVRPKFRYTARAELVEARSANVRPSTSSE